MCFLADSIFKDFCGLYRLQKNFLNLPKEAGREEEGRQYLLGAMLDTEILPVKSPGFYLNQFRISIILISFLDEALKAIGGLEPFSGLQSWLKSDYFPFSSLYFAISEILLGGWGGWQDGTITFSHFFEIMRIVHKETYPDHQNSEGAGSKRLYIILCI